MNGVDGRTGGNNGQTFVVVVVGNGRADRKVGSVANAGDNIGGKGAGVGITNGDGVTNKEIVGSIAGVTGKLDFDIGIAGGIAGANLAKVGELGGA